MGFWGREKSLPLGTDAVTLASAIFPLEGRRESLFPHFSERIGETLGSVRAAASSSSLSFLEVLLDTGRFRVLGSWWEFVGEDAAVASHFRFR